MSFVGPRPLLPAYLQYYLDSELPRFEVRPGLTGLAQVSGRNNLSWHKRLATDAYYAENHRLYLDLWILARTAIKALRRADVVVVAGDTGEPLNKERSYPSASGYSLRKLYRRDLAERVRWFNEKTALRYMQLGAVDIGSTQAWYEATLGNPDRMDFALIDSLGEPVAMTGLRRVDGESAEFYVVVAPEQRGKGLGTLATDLTLQWVKQMGFCRTIQLSVHSGNAAARHIYENAGYRVTEATGDRIYMEKDL